MEAPRKDGGPDREPVPAGSKSPVRVVGRGRSTADGIRGVRDDGEASRRADLEQLRREPRDPRLSRPRHSSRGVR